MITSQEYDISDIYPLNEECVFLSYKAANGFEKPSLHTNPIIASYVTMYGRLELYSYLEKLNKSVLYYDTDSVVFKSEPGGYRPEISPQVGKMTDELSGDYITTFVSNGAKSYAYRTGGGSTVIKCKGFTLNKLAADQITFDVLEDMALAEENNKVKINQGYKIVRQRKRLRICTETSEKTYTRTFDKRVRIQDNSSIPYGYLQPSNTA